VNGPRSELIRLLALRSLNLVGPAEVIEWARSAMTAGIDSEGVRIVAGHTGLPNDFELDADLRRAAREIGYIVHEQDHWVSDYIRQIAEGIVSGAIPPRQGAEELTRLGRSTQRDELLGWASIAEDFYTADLTGINLPALVKRTQADAQKLLARTPKS
jgi:hypothetical protein